MKTLSTKSKIELAACVKGKNAALKNSWYLTQRQHKKIKHKAAK